MDHWNIIPDYGMEKVFPRLWEANQHYLPDYRLSAPLIFIRRPLSAKATYGDGPGNLDRGWNEFSEGKVDVRFIAAGHLDLFVGETTKELAKIVGEVFGSAVVGTREGHETATSARTLTTSDIN
jgi:hypothetical protein